MSSNKTSSRKLVHIKIVLENDVESREGTLLENVRLPHNPLPEVNFVEIDTSVSFLGKSLKAPLMITGMTGGHPDVAWINEALARVAEREGIALGVGSQRAALEDPSLEYTFRVAREVAPKSVIVANIGAPQIAKGISLDKVKKAVKMIDADAIAIHLNPGQEVFQPEGEPIYRDVIKFIKNIVDEIGVKVIVKETGTGLNGTVARELWEIGVDCFDVSGLGGTSWIKVETYRREFKKDPNSFPDLWGNPTAVAIADLRTSVPEACIIASGGIRNGLDAAKSIALGADLVGFALPALRILYSKGEEGLYGFINNFIWQLKVAMFLTGSRTIRDLQLVTPIIWGRLRSELESLNIDLNRLSWSKLRRVLVTSKEVRRSEREA